MGFNGLDPDGTPQMAMQVRVTMLSTLGELGYTEILMSPAIQNISFIRNISNRTTKPELISFWTLFCLEGLFLGSSWRGIDHYQIGNREQSGEK